MGDEEADKGRQAVNEGARGMKPRLLDLFCGAGGCTKGYQRAGFYVVGVDIEPQPNYCGDEFIQADALEIRLDHIGGYRRFDAVHAGPPCQVHTTMSNRWRGKGGRADEHVDLIPATRILLTELGLPYVIENVGGARASLTGQITLLRGGMFGLGVDRPRLFECSFPLLVPGSQPVSDPVGVYGHHHDGRLLFRRSDGTEQRAAATLEQAQEAMGIDWMSWDELRESIPPAYTEHIGHYLMLEVKAREPRVA